MEYFNDFSGETVGEQPASTSLRYGASAGEYLVEERADSTGGNVLNVDTAASTVSALSFDAIDSDSDRANSELVMRFIAPGGIGIGRLHALFRGDAGAGDVNGYAHGINNSANQKVLSSYLPSLDTFGSAAFTAAANTWFMIRARANGPDHKVTVWQGAPEDEPSSWDVEVSNSDDLDPGVVGLLALNAANFKVDFVGISTGGGTAPTSQPTGPTLTAPASISPGETIAFSCSFEPTGVTASDGTSTLTLTSIVNTSGDNYTAVVPALPASGQSLQYTTFGAVTMSATDGTETAEDTTVLAAAEGQTVTIIEEGFSTGELSWLFGFDPDPAPIEPGDQGIESSPNLALDAFGGYVADVDGTYYITAIDKTDGVAQTYPLILGDEPADPPAGIGRITRRHLTRRSMTRRSLTARP